MRREPDLAALDRLFPLQWEGGRLRAATGARLTRREVQVLRLVAAGATHAEVARALRIRERSARDYASRVGQELGLCRVHLAVFWDRLVRAAPAAPIAGAPEGAPSHESGGRILSSRRASTR